VLLDHLKRWLAYRDSRDWLRVILVIALDVEPRKPLQGIHDHALGTFTIQVAFLGHIRVASPQHSSGDIQELNNVVSSAISCGTNTSSRFELAQGAQLHIDMDDEWREISHHRIIFKSYESMLRDPASDATFKSWPKPLTLEHLEDQYRKWMTDLTSFCWIDEPVRDLGSAGLNGGDGRTGSIGGLSDGGVGHDNTLPVRGIGGNGGRDI